MKLATRPPQSFPGIIAACLIAASAGSPLEGQAGPRWRLAPPDFEVGGVSADGADALAELGGVTILGNGNVVVGDRVQPFLKVFGPDETFLRELGHFGSGPGEYQYVYEMDWCARGELSVFDADGRVHRYKDDMDFVSTEIVLLEAIGGSVAYSRDCHPNGLQIVTGWGDTRAQFKPGPFEATAPMFLLRGQAVVHDFGERLSSQRLGSVGSEAGSLRGRTDFTATWSPRGDGARGT